MGIEAYNAEQVEKGNIEFHTCVCVCDEGKMQGLFSRVSSDT